ncbi:hypothetical protein BDV96DRAFT_606665 [Lophiotrema nucula]|uniref:Uncharacterized protein n=1 Tax=Lophiotrema nucula TaxID=690887 RepID=A0A6A5YJA2_9PLEO|nr:hypothetical protein BDV96DRAFT_606665 [Lophiotrema nucula]
MHPLNDPAVNAHRAPQSPQDEVYSLLRNSQCFHRKLNYKNCESKINMTNTSSNSANNGQPAGRPSSRRANKAFSEVKTDNAGSGPSREPSPHEFAAVQAQQPNLGKNSTFDGILHSHQMTTEAELAEQRYFGTSLPSMLRRSESVRSGYKTLKRTGTKVLSKKKDKQTV